MAGDFKQALPNFRCKFRQTSFSHGLHDFPRNTADKSALIGAIRGKSSECPNSCPSLGPSGSVSFAIMLIPVN
jgi:hypothetical protein